MSAAPGIRSAYGTTGVALLGGGLLVFFALAGARRRLGSSPIVASALGSALACWILQRRFADVADAADASGLPVVALIGVGALAFFFAARQLPASVALPRARDSLWLALAAVGIAFGSAAIQRGPTQESLQVARGDSNRPPVVLIVLDTVRADHLALYGYYRDTMPKLESFARREAVVVRRAVQPAPGRSRRMRRSSPA